MKTRHTWTSEMFTPLRRMFAAGQSDAAIALRLGIAMKAVRTQRSRLGLVKPVHVGKEEKRVGAAA